MLKEELSQLWKRSSSHRLIILSSVLSIATLCYQLQRVIPLGRYQHYAIAIAVFALGCFLQIPVSWRQMRLWTRVSYIMTAAFFTSVSVIFWCNPWLDWNVAVQTEEREHLRVYLCIYYFVCAILLTAVCVKSWMEDDKLKRLRQMDQQH